MSAPAPDDKVTVDLSADQVQALLGMILSNPAHDDTLDALGRELSSTQSGAVGRAVSNAAFVFAAAQAVIEGAQIDLAAEREAQGVVAAVVSTEKSVAAAALTTAEAARHTRGLNAYAAAEAAHDIADTAAQTAGIIRVRAQALAEQVAAAACAAAQMVQASTAADATPESALVALRLAATVDAAATATANETALAAAAVATAVAAAAVRTALATAEAASAFEREVAQAASGVRMIATSTARDLAVDTDARAVEVALAARRVNQPN